MNKLVGAVSLLVTGALATQARAQSFGSRGDVSFAADRLMGVYLWSESPAKLTLFGLGVTAAAPPDGTSYPAARLGIDVFATDHLSLGGALAYWSIHDRRDGGGDSGVLFAPRVGYTIDFSRSFGFWPRGGVTYRNFEGRNGDELAITLEGMFYGSPAPHFAFVFGPAFDFGGVGKGSETVNLGLLTAGVLGWI